PPVDIQFRFPALLRNRYGRRLVTRPRSQSRRPFPVGRSIARNGNGDRMFSRLTANGRYRTETFIAAGQRPVQRRFERECLTDRLAADLQLVYGKRQIRRVVMSL